MSNFGDFMGSSQGMDLAGGAVGSTIEALTPQTKVNEDFLNRNQNIASQIGNTGKLTKGVSDMALKSGNPIAMAVGAGLKAGTALTKSSMDEFGVVGEGFADKFKSIAGSALNPVEGLRNLMQQGDRKEARDRFTDRNIAMSTSQNQEMGNKISNSFPRYEAPAYGRQGLKIQSKFSR